MDEDHSKEGEPSSEGLPQNKSESNDKQFKPRVSHKSHRKEPSAIENESLFAGLDLRQNQSSHMAKSSLMSQLQLDLSNALKGKNPHDKVHPEEMVGDPRNHEDEQYKTRVTANTQRGLVKDNRLSRHSNGEVDKASQ